MGNIKQLSFFFSKEYFFVLLGFVLCIENRLMGDPTLLMDAIQNKQPLHIVRQLIMGGEDVNVIDIEFLRWVKPVLRYALDRGTNEESVEIIKLLISDGANVNAFTYNRVLDKKLYGMMPLLAYATIYSSTEIVQIFIDAGAKDAIISGPLSFKKTAQMIAQELEKSDIVFVLKSRAHFKS